MSIQEQVHLGYNIIDDTGLFTQACRDLHILAPALQTFDEFKNHFKRWDHDRSYTETTASAGYHGANQVVPRPITPLPRDTRNTIEMTLRPIFLIRRAHLLL